MKKGFTLIELIIVVIILGILAAVGIPQYMKAIEKARGAEGYAGLGYIQSGEKIYYATNEAYFEQDPLLDPGEKVLDISLPQSRWTFGIVRSLSPAGFTATATRSSGPCIGDTMVVTQAGGLNDTDWRTCQEGL